MFLLLLLLPWASMVMGRALWSSQPARAGNALRTSYPIGNGKVAALPFGPAGNEKVNINRDSLWTGGPFENSTYAGGSPGQRYQFLPGIRDWIWKNGRGNVTRLMGSNSYYGSYSVLGNLSVTIAGINAVTGYNRSLDLSDGVHTTAYNANGAAYAV